MSEIISNATVEKGIAEQANSLGWAAAWILCAFNGFYFLETILDYLYNLIDLLRERGMLCKKS